MTTMHSASRSIRSRGVRMTHRSFYVVLFSLILLCLLIACALQLFSHSAISSSDNVWIQGRGFSTEISIPPGSQQPQATAHNCTFHTCFDVYHCGYNDDNRIAVYIYPLNKYVDENGNALTMAISKEFSEVLQTIAESTFYTSDPAKACVFVPPIDVLNQNTIRLEETAQILASLPGWNEGTNHLLFNMLPGTLPEFNTTLDVVRDKAIVAGGGFSTWTYRRTYDVAIPVFNPMTAEVTLAKISKRSWLAVSAQIGLHAEYREDLAKASMAYPGLLLLDSCSGRPRNFTERCDARSNMYRYPHVLQDASFCLVIRGNRLGQTTFSDCLMAGSIPVVVADSFILPFSEVLDWKRAAIVVDEDDLTGVMAILANISSKRIESMRQQGDLFWRSYFTSMKSIALTTLQIINDRVYPYAAKKYEEWNEAPSRPGVQNPLFLPLIPAKTAGFTAVILTYDRLDSLFKIIQHVALAPSLSKVLVIWNNQIKAPPQASVWPKINKPLKVVQTRHNKLSNRFYPYDEIETEAILALDDDILMLTIDELEFGYEVWREFSDRLVGFPSRLHLWDNTTNSWRYESEWTSEISMVLTGAAFYHKYFNYLYTNAMPGNIKGWVDEHMNCEDIAFNFLIANTTGKPPIKVTPRQKFKCPECPNTMMLSGDLGGHMVERSECISNFAKIYEMMPLQTVEFRADPVLYKDNFPSQFKWFDDMGSL